MIPSNFLFVQANAGFPLPLASKTVQSIITSPPYLNLREYGTSSQVWDGDSAHDHEWQGVDSGHGRFCACGAWQGELGREPTLKLYIDHLVSVFVNARRVLRDDGTIWVNLGDSYSGSHGNGFKHTIANVNMSTGGKPDKSFAKGFINTLPAKNLMGVPWRFAFAMQDAGFILRSAIPWIKLNGLPESVEDRPATAHEYWFLFSVSPEYYFDMEAVKRPIKTASADRSKYKLGRSRKYNEESGYGQSPHSLHKKDRHALKALRAWRTRDGFFDSLNSLVEEEQAWLDHVDAVLEQNGLMLDRDGDPLALIAAIKGLREAHFASFPPELIRPLIRCSTSAKGQCAQCGAPYRRILKELEPDLEAQQAGGGNEAGEYFGQSQKDYDVAQAQDASETKRRILKSMIVRETIGWEATCEHQAEVVPQIVLDIFSGAGTVAKVAEEEGRCGLGLELNWEYAELARNRRL